jgi:hypothetical protein
MGEIKPTPLFQYQKPNTRVTNEASAVGMGPRSFGISHPRQIFVDTDGKKNTAERTWNLSPDASQAAADFSRLTGGGDLSAVRTLTDAQYKEYQKTGELPD